MSACSEKHCGYQGWPEDLGDQQADCFRPGGGVGIVDRKFSLWILVQAWPGLCPESWESDVPLWVSASLQDALWEGPRGLTPSPALYLLAV